MEQESDVGKLLTSAEVERTLHCSRPKVKALIDSGQLEVVAFGNRMQRITERSLRKLIARGLKESQ